MSCPHIETTAVLAAFGEAPPEYDAHLQDCTACQAVVDAHTETLAVLATSAPGAPILAGRKRAWTRGIAVMLLAAAVLLGVRVLDSSTAPARNTVDSPVPHTHQAMAIDPSFESSLDDELSELELDLALMTLE